MNIFSDKNSMTTLKSVHNGCISDMHHLPNNKDVQIVMSFETHRSFSIGGGMRISLEVNNEVRLLCTGVKEIRKLDTPAPFTVGYTRWRLARHLQFPHTDGYSYSIICKWVNMESHEQYCADDAGNRIPVAEAMEKFKGGGEKLRAFLNEVRQQRLVERQRR